MRDSSKSAGLRGRIAAMASWNFVLKFNDEVLTVIWVGVKENLVLNRPWTRSYLIQFLMAALLAIHNVVH